MAVSHGNTYILDGLRTPFGKFGGSLSDISPVDLSVECSKGLLEKTGVKADQIDHVILGNVVPSTSDCLYGARHLGLKVGTKIETPGYCLNRLCGSGIQVILDAQRMIRAGEADCVLVSGTENMSLIPHLTYGARFGTKYGNLKTVDLLIDSLTDKYAGTPMGITAENIAKEFSITRDQCDKFALSSHQKAAQAYEKNLLQGEISSIPIRKGTCEIDEHLRLDADMASLGKLRPSFDKEGVVTAGNASGIVDGAASLLIVSEKFIEHNGLNPLCELGHGDVVGVDPKTMGMGPVPAVRKLLERSSMKLEDIDLFELNEAFAAQSLGVMKDLNLPAEKVNIWGGAIALGHPLAASGTRITLTLARQLKEHSLSNGIATACIGGGQGIALHIKACK